MGHQTLADLHQLVSSAFERSEDRDGDFLFASRGQASERAFTPSRTQLDDLELNVGQTFEYISGSNLRHEVTVEGIDY